MHQQNKIYGFIPETELLHSKQIRECRIFHNACAILNAKDNFRVVASRGFFDAIGIPFADVLDLSFSDRERLDQFLRSDHSILLLPRGDTSVFLFSDWYSSTGLILAVQLSKKESVVRKIINKLTRSSILSVFSTTEAKKDAADDTAKMIDELFYYTQRIFSFDTSHSPLTQAHLLANLAGCRLEHLDLPFDPRIPNKVLWDRYSAFLLCAFLSLRQTGGAVSAIQSEKNVGKVQNKSSDEEVLDFSFSITQRDLSYERTAFDLQPNSDASSRFAFPFMELPCFYGIELNQADGALTFGITVGSFEPALFTPSFIQEPLRLHFTLRPIQAAV